jgi:predicted RNA polymerase sigma factor
MGQHPQPRWAWAYPPLRRLWPSPVVALNRAVPLAMVAGPEAALAQVAALERDGLNSAGRGDAGAGAAMVLWSGSARRCQDPATRRGMGAA